MSQPEHPYPTKQSQDETYFDLSELDRSEETKFLMRSIALAKHEETQLPEGHNNVSIEVTPVQKQVDTRK